MYIQHYQLEVYRDALDVLHHRFYNYVFIELEINQIYRYRNTLIKFFEVHQHLFEYFQVMNNNKDNSIDRH